MWNQTEQEGAEERSDEDVQVGVVEEDEMAFAIALFFAATRGQVALPNARGVGFELRSEPPVASSRLGRLERIADREDAGLDEISLASAVAVIWHHYEETHHRQAICSRLVAFYSLMVRSRGAIADDQSHPVEGDSSSIVLEPAVIRAVATAPLTIEGQFQDVRFRELVLHAADAGEMATSPVLSSIRSKVQLAAPIEDVVQDLVELLFACESTIGPTDSAQSTHFQVFEKLCKPFTAVSGAQNLQPLLSRALISTRSRYPWLSSALVSSIGRLEGIDRTFLNQHPQEALRAELDLMGSLVKLLRSLLGDGVTLQLLRSVWPLAFLSTRTSSPARP